MIKNIILSCFCIVSSLGFGQVQLPTYDFIDDAFTIKVNKFDFDVYRDSINGTLNGPHFFATPIKLDFDLKQLSKKTVLDNGYLYEVNIESKGALGLSIFFSSL